jgi:hypothetical protein
MKLECLWHLLIVDVRPPVASPWTERAGGVSHSANSEGLCVAHGITISGDHSRCKHGSLITMMQVTFFYACK